LTTTELNQFGTSGEGAPEETGDTTSALVDDPTTPVDLLAAGS